MRGVSVIIFLGILVEWGSAQFLNNRPYPTYSLEQMPDTDFTCRDKILGGYYADPETQCQMFHVCVKVAGVGIQDFRFLCPNGTAFDQDHQICADWEDVDCDATTLYYSSDNFDLYRIGSGFESKAVKYGEDEEAFSLQRAETGDVRLNREHQSQRVNQQKDYNYRTKPNNQNTNNNVNRNNNYNSNNNERDIFKGSSSSNFFNNRNGGKETDDDDYDSGNVNANQNDDRFQKRKLARKQQQNRRTDYNQDQTQRPSGRPTGFVNNFAGSSYIPTTSRTTTSTTNYNDQYQNNQRVRPRNRVNPQYNNADSFRSNPKNNYEFENGNTNSQVPYSSISTPAPFKQTQQYNNNRQPTQYNDYTITTLAPKPTTRSTENYPSPFTPKQYNNNYPSTAYKTTENYPPSVPQQTQTKETENYPTTSVFNNNNRNTQQNVYNTQYEATKTKQTENYPPQQPYKKPTTPFKQTENYPTTFSPKTSPFKSNFPQTYSTTLAPPPRTNTAFTSPSQSNTQYNNNRQSTYNQPPIIKQTPQFTNPSTFQQKQTTQFTQYTPTVPRVTTPYYSSTTPANTRRSNRFDETQYDDGTYSTKYDYDNNAKHGKEEEFLRTAQSTNFASSRNEYLQNSKNTQISTTQKPRPFSVTPNSPKLTDYTKSVNNPSPITQNQSRPTTNVSKSPPPPIPPPKSAPNAGKVQGKDKKTKDASYDYAYYDTNVGSDHEYDLGVDIEKSVKTKGKNQ